MHEKIQKMMTFPQGFLWGASTSSYQIEGGAAEGGRKDSIWDVFCREPGRIRNGDTGEVAADHYHRWKEDVKLMSEIGLKCYRFSLAWPRILPDGRGKVNPHGLAFYDALIDELLSRNIQPVITLNHWDLPQALQDEGGWESRASIDAFVEYASVAFSKYCDRVKIWITHNEPAIIVGAGYRNGNHAPGKKDPDAAMFAAHHLLVSHGAAVKRMREIAPGSFQGKFGIALSLSAIHPEDPNRLEDLSAARRAEYLTHRLYLDALYKGSYSRELFEYYPSLAKAVQEGDMEITSTPIDFLGVQYYTKTVCRGEFRGDKLVPVAVPHEETPYSSMWAFYPEGISEVIEYIWSRYSPKEFIITENGTAVDDEALENAEVHDVNRIAYIRAHLEQVHKMIEKSIPITGYFVWSLLDNFEWAWGYEKRFGIIYVDYTTMNRIIKASGRWFGKIAGSNSLFN